MAKKLEERNKQESKIFREKMESRIDEFLKLPIGEEKNRRLVMEPMAKYECCTVWKFYYFCIIQNLREINFEDS